MDSKEIFKKVRKIEIKTRGLSNQIFAGQYHSAFKGKGMTFNEVREYQFGDDVRNIEWNVTARLNHPYIKVFDEEREMTVMLLIDVSGSNEFGTSKQFKLEVITEIAAVLAFSAIKNNDKVGVIFFSNKIEKFIPPKKGSSHILRIIRELVDFKAEEKETNISEALKYFSNVIKKRCTAFLISDFYDKNWEQSIRLASRKHDLIALNVFDEREHTIPNMGIIRIRNAETGKIMQIDSSSKQVRQAYTTWANKKLLEVNDIFKRNGIDNASIRTDHDYVRPLINLFRRREHK
ncbi:MAG: DUF58 domain-containing protein [Bacteroidales bacterium]